MTAPTLADFRARHAAFEGVPDATVEAYLEDATSGVAAYIGESVLPRCILLLAAHDLTLEGYGDASSAGLAEARMAGAKKVKDGATEIEFFLDQRPDVSPADELLAGTSYGRRYLSIRNQWRPIGMAV